MFLTAEPVETSSVCSEWFNTWFQFTITGFPINSVGISPPHVVQGKFYSSLIRELCHLLPGLTRCPSCHGPGIRNDFPSMDFRSENTPQTKSHAARVHSFPFLLLWGQRSYFHTYHYIIYEKQFRSAIISELLVKSNKES